MQFRVLSDLALERFPNAAALLATLAFHPERDRQSVLLLAGNVGRPLGAEGEKLRALLAALAPRFLGLFLVSGNREYYQCQETESTLARIDAALHAICLSLHTPARPVVFLQKGEWRLLRAEEEVRLLGCTLWSPVIRAAARALPADTEHVHADPAYLRAIHAEHVAWLRRALGPPPAATPPPLAPPPKATEEEVKTVTLPADLDATPARARDAEQYGPRHTVLCAGGSEEESLSPSTRTLVLTHHAPGRAPDDAVAASAFYGNLLETWPSDAVPDRWVCGAPPTGAPNDRYLTV